MMQAESQVSLDSEAHHCPGNISIHSGDPDVTLFTSDGFTTQRPAKKPTRQWAAWTHQEEESFFAALRQVGKNFEKITCRVQSKNKDQVRHYYYRLVRRMNKLLGPGLCLDAKNSKDTNAAMLRWWSLLEKYSCRASKLHLKPRRFKIFIEALEHQLLKDRKKNIRRRPMRGENCPPAAPSSMSNQSTDAHTAKLVLFDSQNIQKLGPTRLSLKGNVSKPVNRGNTRMSTATKSVRQRRKAGILTNTTVAYKNWEKAAIAGVSLVADAAEHLERTASAKEVACDHNVSEQRDLDPVGKCLPSVPSNQQNHVEESNVHNSLKLKLQLFPIDEITRRVLEMDNHNPHLELTLSSRKKISSILEHLNRKWGSSRIAVGELMLFPYSIQSESLASFQRWTQESVLSAGDVYSIIGTPQFFRLRYGWFANTECGMSRLQGPITSESVLGESKVSTVTSTGEIADSSPLSILSNSIQSMGICEDQLSSMIKENTFAPTIIDEHRKVNTSTDSRPAFDLDEPSDTVSKVSCHRKPASEGSLVREIEDADNQQLSDGKALSTCEWADSLTNISVGDLLSGVSEGVDADCIDAPIAGSAQCCQHIPFSSDSFDAAIAAHIYSNNENKVEHRPTVSSHSYSIWDAEETCDAFSFGKSIIQDCPKSSIMSVVSRQQVAVRSSEELHEEIRSLYNNAQEDAKEERVYGSDALDCSAKDFSGLADMYWPDSLGPLDLDMIPSSKYHSEELILSDSLGGLSRLIASSLDAFQNCSFFGLDKKETSATIEARETASSSDSKFSN